MSKALSSVTRAIGSFTHKDFIQMLVAVSLLLCTAMLMPQYAFAADGLGGVLDSFTGKCIIVGGLILACIVIKGIVDYMKGETTPGKIFVKCGIVILLIGVIIVAGNIESISESMGTIADSAVEVASDTAKDVVGK